MKLHTPEYRVAELAVLIKIIDDARADIQEAKTENRTGRTTDDSRETAIDALTELHEKFHDMLYDIARDFVPFDR